MNNFRSNRPLGLLRISGTIAVLSLILFSSALSQYANPASVALGAAGNFRVLAGTTVTIGTGNTITGDVGVSPGTTVTNNGTVNGSTHLDNSSAIQAQSDLLTAYNDAAGRTSDETIGSELGGTVIGRGTYVSASGTFAVTGNVTLNGSANDIFIFKMATTLTTAIGSSVILTGGAQASNIFWQVGSSATIDGDFKGNIIALTAITQNTASTINGRTLALNSFVTVNGNSVLPVELTSFSAASNRSSAILRWTTATEVNNYGFEIERTVVNSQPSIVSWSTVGFVEGNGTTNAAKQYSFTDNGISAGKYSYRLKQIDRNGQFEYSRSVEVTTGHSPKEFALLQNYPNPFNPSTMISYQLPLNGHVTVKVFDAIGREVAVLVNERKEAGDHSVRFDASSLSGGIYFCMINAGEFTATKKLTLVK